MIATGQSWFAPRDVERIPTTSTPAAVAAQQVLRLAATLAVGTLPFWFLLVGLVWQVTRMGII